MRRSLERARVAAARSLMWTRDDPRECQDCGAENPRDAPCCGVCGGPLDEGNE